LLLTIKKFKNMKKLLFFAFAVLYGLNLSAQPGWEVYWSGYSTESRGISRFGILNDANHDVAWSVAYDGSGNGANITAVGVTTDGGLTWTTYDPVSLPGGVALGISMVYPTDENTAYIAAYSTGFGNGGLWKTTDRGASWTQINTSTMYTNSNSFPNLIYFYDNNNGFAQGDPINGEFEMYLTTDAGATWTPIPGSDIDDPLAGEYGYTGGYVVAGSTTWFTTNKGRLYRSTDQGHTWTAHDTPLTDFGGQNDNGSVTFKDDNEGWILRGNGELYHSTDAGDTWTQMSPTGLEGYSGDIAFVPGTANTLIAVDADQNHAGSAISTDGGLTWTKIIDYNFDGGPWEQLNATGQIQHTCVAMRDINFGLSGGFSHQDDPNDAQDSDTGVFKFINDILNVNDNKIIGLNIFPNPANDIVNVSVGNEKISDIAIFDITGKQVISLHNISLNNTQVDVSNLEKGIYLMKVVDESNAQQTIKLVIK
jgi:photosystem II stability/assembly factor-like uncharacterized protein